MAIRERTLALQREDPTLLKASLRRWILAAAEQASRVSSRGISTRRLSRIVFGFRALGNMELVRLLQASNFAEAIYRLTDINVGCRKAKIKREDPVSGDYLEAN